ncbi:MAG: hypothetical protein NTU61_02165 [Candidatus Altiarchaeota archaeon]|nr:hypothetical protein [Candidatus Altiarchaeota archaeon]
MSEVISLGLDIGGANVKITAVSVSSSGEFRFRHYSNKPMLLKDFTDSFKAFKSDFKEGFDVVGVTTTGEYGIVFPRLSDGIGYFRQKILGFFKEPVYWMKLDGGMVNLNDMKDPYEVVASNWVASSLFVGRHVAGDCIMVDAGSTTTDVIPIAGGHPVNESRFDHERLASGNLVYTGGINTHAGCIMPKVSVDGSETMVSSEYFCTAGDVHYILGNINSLTYRTYLGAFLGYSSPEEAYTRLAHLVCADDKLLSRDVIVDVARQLYDEQLRQISEAIKRVYLDNKSRFKTKPPVVVTGLCAGFLAKAAAEKAGFKKVVSVGELFGSGVEVATPSFAVAVLAGKKLLNVK